MALTWAKALEDLGQYQQGRSLRWTACAAVSSINAVVALSFLDCDAHFIWQNVASTKPRIMDRARLSRSVLTGPDVAPVHPLHH